MATTTQNHNDAPLLGLSSLEPTPPVTVSQWADLHQVVTLGPERGQWKTDRTPYLREPMDALSDPYVEEVTACFAAQTGKTALLRNFIGYAIDHDPSEMLVVMPDPDSAKAWAWKHIRSMAKSCPAVAAHTTGREDDLAGDYYQFDRMYIKLAGAGSPDDLSGDSCRYVLFDEVDKFPKWSGTEADPISLGKKRARNFPWNRKILKTSTPVLETDFIWSEYLQSDRRRYWVKCPKCGEFQPLSFRRDPDKGPARGRIRWPETATHDEIRDQLLAYFECGHCESAIYENHKEWMVSKGVWCPSGLLVNQYGELVGDYRPSRHRGYQAPVLVSPWVSWSEVVRDFIKANREMKKGNAAPLMDFVNSSQAEPWKEIIERPDKEKLRHLIGGHQVGEIPAGALILTACVDVQKDYFLWSIVGWGYRMESWVIRYGRSETFEDVIDQVLRTGYPTANGKTKHVSMMGVDSGNDTQRVYDLVRLASRLFPGRVVAIKGDDHVAVYEYRKSTIDKDREGRPFGHSLILYLVDVSKLKDQFARYLAAQSGDTGEVHFPAGTDDGYLDQLTSEAKQPVRDKRTKRVSEKWVHVSGENHYLDISIYNLALAKIIGLDKIVQPGEAKVYELKKPTQLKAIADQQAERDRPSPRERSRLSMFNR